MYVIVYLFVTECFFIETRGGLGIRLNEFDPPKIMLINKWTDPGDKEDEIFLTELSPQHRIVPKTVLKWIVLWRDLCESLVGVSDAYHNNLTSV